MGSQQALPVAQRLSPGPLPFSSFPRSWPLGWSTAAEVTRPPKADAVQLQPDPCLCAAGLLWSLGVLWPHIP